MIPPTTTFFKCVQLKRLTAVFRDDLLLDSVGLSRRAVGGWIRDTAKITQLWSSSFYTQQRQ